MSKSRSEKAKRVRKKIRAFLYKGFYFILLPPILLGSYALSDSIHVKTDVLSVIVTASSFIAAIITGFLLQSHYRIKDARLEKLSRFADLQNRLREYAWAFWHLTFSLTRTYALNWRFPDSIEKLERDEDWNRNNEDSVAIMFVRYLKDFAERPNSIPDFELTQTIIPESRLEQMHRYMAGAAGILARHKHFKYILKSFKLPDTSDLDRVIITNDLQIKNAVKRLKKGNQNFNTLGFWEARIGECLEILARMKMNGRFVYSFGAVEIKQLGLNLLFLSAFGILLPITVLIANGAMPASCQSFLTIVSGVGFMVYFVVGLHKTFSKLSSSQLSYA